jgi:hypothetical protein
MRIATFPMMKEPDWSQGALCQLTQRRDYGSYWRRLVVHIYNCPGYRADRITLPLQQAPHSFTPPSLRRYPRIGLRNGKDGRNKVSHKNTRLKKGSQPGQDNKAAQHAFRSIWLITPLKPDEAKERGKPFIPTGLRKWVREAEPKHLP